MGDWERWEKNILADIRRKEMSEGTLVRRSTSKERITIKDVRANVFVTVVMVVDDVGKGASNRFSTSYGIVRMVTSRLIVEDLKSLETVVEDSGVLMSTLGDKFGEKDLAMNCVKGLHRIVRKVADEINDRIEGKVIDQYRFDGATRLVSVIVEAFSSIENDPRENIEVELEF
jgi:hypothetical protein